jgi:hypothetical protein
MALFRNRRDSGMNYWPGFVDALSTLILSIIFLLTVFMVAQFFLSQEVSGKNTALARLTAQISRLSELLSLVGAQIAAMVGEARRPCPCCGGWMIIIELLVELLGHRPAKMAWLSNPDYISASLMRRP